MAQYDLVLKNGYLIDKGEALNGVADIAMNGDKIAAIGKGLNGKQEINVTGQIVTAGLIDLHTHVYYGGTSLSVDPLILAKRGCTTLVDTGSAGAGNFQGFLDHVISPCPVRIIPYLNISFAGIYAFSKNVMVGESGDQRLLAPIDCLEVLKEHKDVIAGVKVRVGKHASGDAGIIPLQIAREVADEVGMPMMVHIDHPPPTLEEVLGLMKKGDILTHCFRPFPNSPLHAGEIRKAVLEARRRGIIFDIGHGMGSFSFDVARQMLEKGFAPDTISSDVHALCIEGPAFDLTTTMSKFLCLGMPLDEVIMRSTLTPAKALHRTDLGRLKVGLTADISLLKHEKGRFTYTDSTGKTLEGQEALIPQGIIFKGKPL